MSQGFSKDPSSHPEDAPAASGDIGTALLSVRQDSIVSSTSTDGDYAAVKSDSTGRIYSSTKIDTEIPAGTQNIGDVDVVSVISGTGATNLGKATDATAGASDVGVASLLVRDDALTTITPADGDWAPGRINARGATWIAIEDGAGAQVTSFGGGTQYTVDAVAPAAPVGPTLVAERDDQLSALAEVEGDWTNARATSKGALWVALADSSGDPITSFGGGTQYTEDAAAAADPVGNALILVRKDTLAGLTTTDGDNVAARGTDKGEQYVKHVDTVTISGAVTNTVLSVVGSGTEATAQRVTIATDSTGVLSVDDNGANLSIDDGGNSITVDNTVLSVVGSGTEATAQRVTIATDSTGVLSVDDNGGNLSIDDGGNSITVDNTVLSVVGSGTEATAQRVTIATDSTGVLSVDDNSGSLTVDNGGTFATQVTAMPTASTATITAVNCASSATIFAANASRKGAWITNDGAGILYVKMGTTATSTDYTVKIAGGGFYELPGVPYLYVGRVDGIFDGTGAAGDRARATELT